MAGDSFSLRDLRKGFRRHNVRSMKKNKYLSKSENPQVEFFQSAIDEQMKTLRWSLCPTGGNLSATTLRDLNGRSVLQLVCAYGKTRALKVILASDQFCHDRNAVADHVDDAGRTVLMIASFNGQLEVIKMLLNHIDKTPISIDDKRHKKGFIEIFEDPDALRTDVQEKTILLNSQSFKEMICNKGKTAKDYAECRGHQHVIDFLNTNDSSMFNSKVDSERSSGKSSKVKNDGKKEEKIKVKNDGKIKEKMSLPIDPPCIKEDADSLSQTIENIEDIEERHYHIPPLPPIEGRVTKWPEVSKAYESYLDLNNRNWQLDLNLAKEVVADCDVDINNIVDPLLWQCEKLHRLRLHLSPCGSLSILPDYIGMLKSLQHLTLAGNGLTKLPDHIGMLTSLLTLDLSDNCLCQLPRLDDNLESLDVRRNQLKTLAIMPSNLVMLHVDENQLEKLDGLGFERMTRLNILTCSNNRISHLPPGLGSLKGSLVTLNVAKNVLEDVCPELGLLKKNLRHLDLRDNLIKDKKVKKLAEKASEKGARELVVLLKYIMKTKKGKKK